MIGSKTRLPAENIGTALNSMMSRYMKVSAAGWNVSVTTDEGDIVKIHKVVLSPDDKIGWVEYTAQYGYSIRFGNRRCRQSDWANDECAKYEVIGNIFEDKQLLEVAEHDAE